MISVAARKSKKNASATIPRTESERTVLSQNKSVYIALAAITVVVLLCYMNALGNGFVFDDHGHVLDNKSLRSLANLPKLLLDYRPLRDISYAVDFALWGERPFGFHLTSILIHAANALLVFALIFRVTRKTLLASFAALIFAIHPLQPDAVTYISGRRDVLFALFYVASFHFYLTYRRHVSNKQKTRTTRMRGLLFFALFLLSWVFSLASKEMAASLPLFVFAWNFCDVWDQENDSWPRQVLTATRKAFSRDKWLYIFLSAAALAYVWYQVFFRQASSRAGINGFNYWGGSFYTNLLTAIHVHGWYLKQLVFPTPIVQYSGAFDVATSLWTWRVLVSIIVVCGTIVAGFSLLNRNKLMAFAILSYFAMLVPVSQIIPHHELLADHYLYLPMMSLGLFAALLVQKLSSRNETAKRVTYGVAAAVVVAFAVMTLLRNPIYKDDFTLWKTNYKEVPTSIRAVSSLASQYATSYPARGADLYKQCIAIDPSYAPAYVSLAALYQAREKAREAEDIIQRGLALPDSRVISPGYEDPNRFRSELTTALAISKGFQGLQGEAEGLLLKAIDLYPANSQPYTLLASAYHSTDKEKEIEALKRQVAVFPDDYYPLQTLSLRFIEAKRYDEALPYLERMLSMVPNDFYTNYELGQIYRTKKDCSRAGRYLMTAKPSASSPDDSKAIDDAIGGYQRECGGS